MEDRLHYFRKILVLGIVGHTLWGVIYPIIVPNTFDSFLIRLQVTWVLIIIVIGSYFNKKISQQIEKLTYFCIMLVTSHFFFITYKNNFSIYYLMSFLTLCGICAYIIMSRKFLVFYTMFFNLLAAVMAYQNMFDTTVLILWLDFITLMIFGYFFTVHKIAVYQKLEETFAALEKTHKEVLSKSEGIRKLYDTAAKMAHDIRSPLSALEFVSSSLSERELKQKEIIGKSITRISDIASDMLVQYKGLTKEHVDVTFKIPESSPPQVESSATSITEVLKDIVEEKKLEAQNKHNVMITLNPFKESVFTNMNSSALGRIFSNILNNSIEAMDSKHSGEIKISVSHTINVVNVTFLDNGKGMSDETLKNIFNKGFTYGKANGNGLGLSSAKEILDANNAKIEVYSKPNVGTQVQLQFVREHINSQNEKKAQS